MSGRLSLAVLILLLLISGCGDEDSLTEPEKIIDEWSFPENLNFAITLYSEEDSVAVGDSFDVKIVFYNIRIAFGTVMEISYNSDIVEISQVISGPYFSPDSLTIMLSVIEPDLNRISYGVSYVKDSGMTVSGSGIVAKLRCIGKNRGTAKCRLTPGKFEIIGTDGNLVTNFRSLTITNATVIVE